VRGVSDVGYAPVSSNSSTGGGSRFGISVGRGNVLVFILVMIKLVLGTTERSVIESCITNVSCPPPETARRDNFLLVGSML